MICCLSPDERLLRERDKLISRQIKDKARQREQVMKLLLLGTGESGKSTILKQMKLLSNQKLEEGVNYNEIIADNIFDAITSLVRAMYKFRVRLANESLMKDAAKFRNLELEDMKLTEENAKIIKDIWEDQNMGLVYKRKSEFQLNDTAGYFLDKVEEIAKPKYVPTVGDMIKARTQTQSIVHINFTFEGMNFDLTDVGGQRRERLKWVDCFSNVKAILFIVGISEYDQVLREDNKTNRMVESLALFGKILQYGCFISTSFVLFLNKIDLFYEKVKTKPITTAFPEYRGRQTHDDCLAYIRKNFLMANNNPNRTIYCFKTCATDTENIRKVFVSVKNSVLMKSIGGGGLI